MMKDLQIDTSKLIVAGIVILSGVLMANSKTDYTDTMSDWSTKQDLRCDYQGCKLVNKPQPFSWYNTGE